MSSNHVLRRRYTQGGGHSITSKWRFQYNQSTVHTGICGRVFVLVIDRWYWQFVWMLQSLKVKDRQFFFSFHILCIFISKKEMCYAAITIFVKKLNKNKRNMYIKKIFLRFYNKFIYYNFVNCNQLLYIIYNRLELVKFFILKIRNWFRRNTIHLSNSRHIPWDRYSSPTEWTFDSSRPKDLCRPVHIDVSWQREPNTKAWRHLFDLPQLYIV